MACQYTWHTTVCRLYVAKLLADMRFSPPARRPTGTAAIRAGGCRRGRRERGAPGCPRQVRKPPAIRRIWSDGVDFGASDPHRGARTRMARVAGRFRGQMRHYPSWLVDRLVVVPRPEPHGDAAAFQATAGTIRDRANNRPYTHGFGLAAAAAVPGPLDPAIPAQAPCSRDVSRPPPQSMGSVRRLARRRRFG